MDLTFVAQISSPAIPDPEQVSNLIPAAFAELVGGDPSSIVVKSVSINVMPVVFPAPVITDPTSSAQ